MHTFVSEVSIIGVEGPPKDIKKNDKIEKKDILLSN